jgi:hypothetical protein
MDKSVELLFSTKIGGQQEALTQLSSFASEMARVIESQLAPVFEKLQNFGGAMGPGGAAPAGGGNMGGGGGGFTPPPPMSGGSGANYPGNIYGLGATAGSNNGFSAHLMQMADNPYYSPNLEVSLAASEARATSQARKAGVDVDITGKGKDFYSEMQETSKDNIATALVSLKVLNDSIREAAKGNENLAKEIADLQKELKTNPNNFAAQGELRSKLGVQNQLNSMSAQQSQLTAGIGSMSREAGYFSEMAGGGAGMIESILAKATPALILALATQLPSLTRSAAIASADIGNMQAGAGLAHDYSSLMSANMQGGYGMVKAHGAMRAGIKNIITPWNYLKFGDEMRNEMSADIDAEKRINTFAMRAGGQTIDDSREAFQTAQGMGSTGMEDFLSRGFTRGWDVRGAGRGLSVGTMKGMRRSIGVAAGSSANDMSDGAYDSLEGLTSLGMYNSAQGAGAMYQGGMDLDKSAAKLKEIYREGIALGIKDTDLPRAIDRISSISGAGYGSAGYAAESTSFGMRASAGAFGAGASSAETNWGTSATANLLSSTTLGSGNMLGEIAGQMGMGEFGSALKAMGVTLTQAQLNLLQSIEQMEAEDLESFILKYGRGDKSQVSGKGEYLLNLLMKSKAGGAVKLGGMVGEMNGLMAMSQMTGAKTLKQVMSAGGIAASAASGGADPSKFTGAIPDSHNPTSAGGQISAAEQTQIATMTVGGIKQLGTNLTIINEALKDFLIRLKEQNENILHNQALERAHESAEPWLPGPKM